jgi:hypothetical protein
MSIYKKQNSLMLQDKKTELFNKLFILKNTVFISNIPKEIFYKDILYQKKFLGQYGHINQIFLINNNKIENSVVAQFDTVNQAALSILALDNFEVYNNEKIKISYYYTKFCHYFLNNKECKNPNCLFIHSNKKNEYLYKEININEYFNSFLFALNILNVSVESFQLVSAKIIGEKFFERQKKFPKMTVKKLKNEENLRNLNQSNNFQSQKSNEINKMNCKKVKSRSHENSLKKLENISNQNLKIRSFSNIETSKINLNKSRTKHSRFLFAKINENNEDKVNVPDFVINTIDQFLKLYVVGKNHNQVNLIKSVNTVNFNANWQDLLLIKNLW